VSTPVIATVEKDRKYLALKCAVLGPQPHWGQLHRRSRARSCAAKPQGHELLQN